MTAQAPLPWPKPNPVAAAAPAGLRRRQSAARRLPPLVDGRRDPIARPVKPATLLQVEVGRRTCWYIGLTRRQFVALMSRAGITRYMHDGRAWCTALEDADQVLAVAEHGLHYRVAVEAVDR